MARLLLFIPLTLAVWLAVAQANYGQARERPERRDDKVKPRDREEKRSPIEKRDRKRVVEVEQDADDVPVEEKRSAPHTMRAKAVLGSKVSIKGNVAIGTVKDIIFDEDGYIEYLMVRNDGKNVLVPWQAAKFNFSKRTATVNITQEKFREVPTFTQEKWPNFYEPTYRKKVYGYYGLNPLQERRIERRERRRGNE